MSDVNKNLGHATAYGYAKSKGYTGTEDEFATLMASYADVAEQAKESAEDSEAWAVGERDGVPVSDTDAQYHNNAKYYAEQAGTSAGESSDSADASGASALVSEGHATGSQDGEPVEEGSPYYHNNALYYSQMSSQSADDADGYKRDAETAETNAETAEGNAEAWAVGTKDSVPVPDTDPQYQNNAKYYAEQAKDSADASAAMTGLANQFDSTTAYAIGDYVLYDGTLYQFTASHPAGAWTGTDAVQSVLSGGVSDLKSQIESVVPKGQLLKQYFYKQNTFIRTNAEEALPNYDLFKVPVSQGDVVFVSQVGGGTIFWNTLSSAYVFSILYANGTYANIATVSEIGAYGQVSRIGIFHIPENATHIMITAYHDYAGDVRVQINTPLAHLDADCVPQYQTVTEITDDKAFVSNVYKQTTGKFAVLSGDYYSRTLRVHAGDVIKCSGLVGALTNYLAFATDNNVVTNVAVSTFTAPADGMINIFAHPSYPQTQTLFPAKSIKIDYSNVLNTPEISNEYSGLTGVAFGTSLTYRAQTTGGYLQYLPSLSGITFDNQGVGSSVIKANGTQPNMMTTITNYSGYSGKRVCILEGFVNDWYYNGDVLGTWKDTGTASVCGCVRTALTHILTQNPNLTVFLVLDPYGKGITASNAVNGAGDTQLEFYEEIAKVAESMGVTVIKEYAISGISELTPQYLMDNIHPTALGAEQSAKVIWGAMKQHYPNLTA